MTLHVWQCYEEKHDAWELICLRISEREVVPLVTSRESNFSLLRDVAVAYGATRGVPVRGVRYDESEVLEVIDP